ncbi:STAS domain-containing protein [Jiangella alkaliphila]|uniref:Anti-anti-sigma factor n=1 Tax=Jiangella alkaliphila TaxID=419479 RepID=A0A1H2L6M1_9ACTN|nr:STAS domain-containing protein [Jiangella alkaliphila]SDU76690.1 anti-anti-sigma factor [Jiangella alkaliphila]
MRQNAHPPRPQRGPARPAVFYTRGDSAVVPLSDQTLREGIHDLRWRLEEMLADGPSALVVDVSGLTRLSSPTIAALLWTKRRCSARGVRVMLSHPDQAMAGLLHRTGLDDVLDIQPPLDSALGRATR